jgi:hypothetical protein
MKRPKNGPSASLPPSGGSREIRMTRRSFLKGTAGFVLLCGAGFGAPGLVSAASDAPAPVGPQLVDGLRISDEPSGARVTAAGLTCFTVNEAGKELLQLADGTHTLEEIIRLSGLSGQAEYMAK